MKDFSMQFLNLTNFFPLSILKEKLLMKTVEQRIMIKVVETKNATFGSIVNERMKQHYLPISKHSSLKVVFYAM